MLTWRHIPSFNLSVEKIISSRAPKQASILERSSNFDPESLQLETLYLHPTRGPHLFFLFLLSPLFFSDKTVAPPRLAARAGLLPWLVVGADTTAVVGLAAYAHPRVGLPRERKQQGAMAYPLELLGVKRECVGAREADDDGAWVEQRRRYDAPRPHPPPQQRPRAAPGTLEAVQLSQARATPRSGTDDTDPPKLTNFGGRSEML